MQARPISNLRHTHVLFITNEGRSAVPHVVASNEPYTTLYYSGMSYIITRRILAHRQGFYARVVAFFLHGRL